MIARVSTLLNGRDSEKVREAGVFKSGSDGRAIVDADWSAIETRLTEAYKILKREVSNGRPAT